MQNTQYATEQQTSNKNSLSESDVLMTVRDNRPTFYLDNNPEHKIRAAGLILYRYNTEINEPEYLMIKYKGRYEDFGGKTDLVDGCINDTVVREADEESNGILSKKKMKVKVDKAKPVYCNWSKYLVYIVKTSKDYKPHLFGDRELHDNIPRTVE